MIHKYKECDRCKNKSILEPIRIGQQVYNWIELEIGICRSIDDYDLFTQGTYCYCSQKCLAEDIETRILKGK